MVKVHIELPSLRKTKQQIFLYICIICVLFFFNRIIHNVNDYNKFVLSIKEYEQLNTNISSYLWLPTTRNSSNVKPNTTNTNSSSTTTKTKTILETNNNNTTMTTTQNNNKQIFAINSHTTTTKIKKDYSNSSKYWNYDDAAPPIQYAITHILNSLPTKHRITQLAITNLTNYLLQPSNIFPNKMHWFEFNPSITILPNRYRIPINNTTTSSSKTPIYLASYRFTYHHGCFPYEQRALMYNFQKKDKKMKQQVPNDAYIGFALLDSELSILFDVVIIVKKKSQLSNSYKIDGSMADYRVFTIHDQLYFTSKSMIGRLEIRSGMSSSSSSSSNNEEGRAYQYNIPTTTNNINNLDQDYVQLQHVQDDGGTDDGTDDTSTTKRQQFTVYLQRQPSCFSYYDKNEKDGSKNILYFVDNNNNTMAEYFPSKPNNSVRSVDLTKPCNPRPTTQQRPQQQQQQQQPDEVSSSSTNNNNNQTTSSSTGAQKQQQQTTTTFKNFHEQKYPQFPKKNGKHNTQSFLTGDRGSGCCIRLEHPTTKQEYLVGILHPKTPYPGKFLPSGVLPNIYLSRFFAMEPFPPYNIVVRTGTFCFGFSSSQELFSHKLIWKERSDFMFMDDTGFKCPRIHFVMSIIDNVVNPDQVIISYGIGDCLPRMIIVDKVDIQAMLWPSSSLPTTNNTNTITKK